MAAAVDRSGKRNRRQEKVQFESCFLAAGRIKTSLALEGSGGGRRGDKIQREELGFRFRVAKAASSSIRIALLVGREGTQELLDGAVASAVSMQHKKHLECF